MADMLDILCDDRTFVQVGSDVMCCRTDDLYETLVGQARESGLRNLFHWESHKQLRG